MESQDEDMAETSQLAQGVGGNVDSPNVEQDARQEMAAISWVQKARRHCKEWFWMSKCDFSSVLVWCPLLTLGLVLGVIVIVWVVHDGHRKIPCQQCPSEWIGYKNKCYFISEEEKNWTSSQTFCSQNESLLAFFENQEEMHSLVKRLKIEGSWIGLRKKGESFYWENGIPLKVDTFQIRNHSECAYLDVSTIYTSACSLPRGWICMRLP